MQALLVLWVCFFFSFSSFAYEEVGNPVLQPDGTYKHPITDDTYAQVPLEFVFPFYGSNFTTSYMFDNGVVGFRDPSQSGVQTHWCCNGLDLQTMAEAGVDISQYGFSIAPLWTDLIDLGADVDGDGVPDSGYFTNGDTTQMTYMWRNLAEFHDATRLNTFQLVIKPDGSYDVDYTAINIQSHSITVGAAGDLTNAHTSGGVGIQGVQQYHYATGYQSAIDGVLGTFNNFAVFCTANALYDPTCPGYAEAVAEQLFQQQCAANPLYDSQCSGHLSLIHI